MIRKQSLKFQFNGKVDGMTIQEEVANWCRYVLNPSVNEALAPYEQNDNIISLNKLTLDINVDTTNDWKKGLAEKIVWQLKEKLQKGINSKSDTVVITTMQKNFSDVMRWYMRHGILPWHSEIKTREEFSKEVSHWIKHSSPAFIKQFVSGISNEKAALRMVELLSQPDLEKLISILLQEKEKYVSTLLEDILFITAVFTSDKFLQKKEIKHFGLTLVTELSVNEALQKWVHQMDIKYPGKISGIRTQTIITSEIKRIAGQMQKKKWSEAKVITQNTSTAAKEMKTALEIDSEDRGYAKPVLKEKKEHDSRNPGNKSRVEAEGMKIDPVNKEFLETIREGIYIENAGGVIIAPFLQTLFSRTGLLNGFGIRDIDRAVFLLHYCISGNTTAAEFELIFPKILCGLPVDENMATDVELSKEQLKEADEMLLSVIEHWAVLKNTSVIGLRESFLQRSGKLSFVNNEWFLKVEQKSYDMLLGHLPWSISMIRLPWMKHFLKTEWVH